MEHFVIEIASQELKALKEFLKVVREERDAIISFSLEGITRENNKKRKSSGRWNTSKQKKVD